jgi:hypothetical protein
LRWCETHELLHATLPDGTIYRLATADIVVEGQPYVGDLKATGGAKQSATRSHDRLTVGIQNADRVMGLTINQFSRTLVGARIVFSRAFRGLEVTWQPHSDYIIDPTMHGYAMKAGTPGFGAILRSSETFGFADGSEVSYLLMSTTQQVRFGFVSPSNDTWMFEIDGGMINTLVNGVVRDTAVAKVGDRLRVISAQEAEITMIVERNDYNQLGTYPVISARYNDVEASYPLVVGMDIYNNSDSFGGLDIEGHAFQRKEILSGEIWDAPVDEDAVEVTLVGELSSGLAFIADRPLQSTCPLIFKGAECGYSGSHTSCNKIYDSPDGCAGRNWQHRFGGVIVRGELSRVIVGGIGGEFIDPDGTIRWTPPGGRYRMPFDDRMPRTDFGSV